MAISLLDGGSPQRNGISLSGACWQMKTAFLYRFLSSTKENSEISFVVVLLRGSKTVTADAQTNRKDMDSNPYRHNPNFVDLLNSQQDVAFGSYEDSVELSSSQVPFLPTQGTADSNFVGNTPPDLVDVVIRSATEPEVNPKPYSTSQGANQDIRALTMRYLTNQEGLNHEANSYGFYTQEGVQANWNWAKIFTEQEVMNFTTQRFSSLSICEYPTLEGDSSPRKERPEPKPI
uniref:Uncharacterized protein n=1 Tax=Brassica campestris TaxID=3711 RepID=M4DSB1_BRACM